MAGIHRNSRYTRRQTGRFLSRVVTGDETKNRLCDALDHLVSLSDNKATLDDDGTLWAMPEQPETGVFWKPREVQKKRHDKLALSS